MPPWELKERSLITIEIAEPYEALVGAALLECAAQAALQHQQAPAQSALTIVITGDDQLKELNTQYLGIDAPTDVLSFPSGDTDPETGELYLGDVLISAPRAESQGAAAGHGAQAELQLLAVHGVLHLLGHDHAEEAEKARMWSAQREILEGLGSPARAPSESDQDQ
jgi:probable rRNA maturation factor